MTSAEVVILGAGISGCALAFHLADRGVNPVVLYDPKTPSAGATGRAAGVVTEQLWDRWDVEVTRESKEQYARLSARWDPSAYAVNGFVRWASTSEAEMCLGEALGRLRGWGVDVHELSPERLAELVPWGRFEEHVRSIHSPSDAIVTPSAMAEIYAQNARRLGAELLFGEPAASFRQGPDEWQLVVGSRTLRARNAVIAAGAWSKRLLERIGSPLPLAPYRTQAAVFRPSAAPASFPSIHDVDVDVYARPETNGRVLAGDGTELREVDPERFATAADPSFLAHLAQTFERRLPGWADAELTGAWAGVCTATPDRRPIVGPVVGAPGLHAMTGFNGFGVMRAGGIARRLAESIASGGEGERALRLLEPVLPARFAGPVRPFPIRPGFTLDSGKEPRF